jgi:mannosyltransferase OCH1-like enzyme
VKSLVRPAPQARRAGEAARVREAEALLLPRVFHQIWLGPDPLPEEFAHYRETWQRHHPDWEHRLWTEENLPAELRRPEARDRLRHPAERSDILRLELLWRHGGVYVDTDFECKRPIEPLLGGLDLFCAYLKVNQVNNAIMGAVAGHPILDRALDRVRPREFYGFDKAAAGPVFVNALLASYPEVAIFEPELFYPNTPEQRDGAYAVHHQARSWKDAEGFRIAALLAEERLAETQQQLQRSERRLAEAKAHIAELEHARTKVTSRPIDVLRRRPRGRAQ